MGCSGSEPGPPHYGWMEPTGPWEQKPNPRVKPLPYLFAKVSQDLWQPPPPPSRMHGGQGSAHGLPFKAKPWWVQYWEVSAMGLPLTYGGMLV